ncbi:MAG: flagellar hook-associated protein FlgK [Halobacteriovorax sp.]|nr:flagellar hook-associated protein FlgK [Halobacteriovorax sp.]|tara:strand:+ start:251940 stop:253406 length:1467 start_codon:yes stop_codon:yes gene_type:complete
MPDILNIGITGLHTSKKSLETTSHNIANVNTEGYSKQRVHQSTNSPISKGGLVQGSGVRINKIARDHDKFVEKRLNSNISSEQFFRHRTEQLEQVENIFNEIDQDGLNKVLNKFFNSFRELSNNPENETIRSVVRDNASLVVKDFHRIKETLDGLVDGINGKIKGEVSEINEITRRVAHLNKKIATLEVVKNETGDLRDQRDELIRELSKSFKIHTYQDEKGRYVVSAVNVGTLVTGTNTAELAAGPVSADSSKSGMPGAMEVYFKNRPSGPITNKFKSGRVSSLINVRNQDIKDLYDKVDLIAHELVQTVNAVHRRGYVNRKVELDANGNPPLSDSKGPTTGLDFFKSIESGVKGAAAMIDLSDDVKNDLSNISTALAPNAPGDNRVAVAISKIQHERILGGGVATLEESYLSSIGNLGLQTRKANLDHEQAEGLKALTENIKQRVSGVSLDEEAANMVRFQQVYEANAKVMQTADEMMKTIMSIKR